MDLARGGTNAIIGILLLADFLARIRARIVVGTARIARFCTWIGKARPLRHTHLRRATVRQAVSPMARTDPLVLVHRTARPLQGARIRRRPRIRRRKIKTRLPVRPKLHSTCRHGSRRTLCLIWNRRRYFFSQSRTPLKCTKYLVAIFVAVPRTFGHVAYAVCAFVPAARGMETVASAMSMGHPQEIPLTLVGPQASPLFAIYATISRSTLPVKRATCVFATAAFGGALSASVKRRAVTDRVRIIIVTIIHHPGG